MRTALVLGALAVPAAVVIGHWCAKHLGTRGIETQLDALYEQVIVSQGAQKHQADMLDRRMRDVEDSVARAENEARIVSTQVAQVSQSLAGRVDQVEHRIELNVIAGRYRLRTPVGGRL